MKETKLKRWRKENLQPNKSDMMFHSYNRARLLVHFLHIRHGVRTAYYAYTCNCQMHVDLCFFFFAVGFYPIYRFIVYAVRCGCIKCSRIMCVLHSSINSLHLFSAPIYKFILGYICCEF